MATILALPPGFGGINFLGAQGPYNGTLTIYATRNNDGWQAWTGADPQVPVSFYGENIVFHIVDGYIVEPENIDLHRETTLTIFTYELRFDGDGGSITKTEVGNGYPNISNPYFPMDIYPIDLTVNISPESPLPVGLHIDSSETATSSGTSQMTYSGPAGFISIRLLGAELFRKTISNSGTHIVDLALSIFNRQLNLPEFEIVEGELTNNTGRVLPCINIYSL